MFRHFSIGDSSIVPPLVPPHLFQPVAKMDAHQVVIVCFGKHQCFAGLAMDDAVEFCKLGQRCVKRLAIHKAVEVSDSLGIVANQFA